jgi:hypothetical protein
MLVIFFFSWAVVYIERQVVTTFTTLTTLNGGDCNSLYVYSSGPIPTHSTFKFSCLHVTPLLCHCCSLAATVPQQWCDSAILITITVGYSLAPTAH